MDKHQDLLKKYNSSTLPGAMELKFSQQEWLNIYWFMLGRERGRPLTDGEKAWNIPQKSDPWGWSSETWESWLD